MSNSRLREEMSLYRGKARVQAFLNFCIKIPHLTVTECGSAREHTGYLFLFHI